MSKDVFFGIKVSYSFQTLVRFGGHDYPSHKVPGKVRASGKVPENGRKSKNVQEDHMVMTEVQEGGWRGAEGGNQRSPQRWQDGAAAHQITSLSRSQRD